MCAESCSTGRYTVALWRLTNASTNWPQALLNDFDTFEKVVEESANIRE